jgi:hypothetical protein
MTLLIKYLVLSNIGDYRILSSESADEVYVGRFLHNHLCCRMLWRAVYDLVNKVPGIIKIVILF